MANTAVIPPTHEGEFVRDGFTISSYDFSHDMRTVGASRMLGERPADPRYCFADGEVFTKAQISGYVWSDRRGIHEAWHKLPDDVTFRCSLVGRDPREPDNKYPHGHYNFTLLTEPLNPNVGAVPSRSVIEALEARGWSTSRIAKNAGLGRDTVAAVRDAREEVKLSTETALMRLAQREGL